MDRFLTLLIQDPILLVASLVLVVTAVILAWAVKSMLAPREEVSYELPDEDMPAGSPEESSGLTEARLAEINSQLTELSKRLSELDKNMKENRPDQTVPAMASVPVEMEKLAQRIEAKIDKSAASPSPHEAEVLGRIEAKLEGIHKLLILLTDSGNK